MGRSNPSVRASYLRGFLGGVDRLGPAGASVRRKISDSTLTAIECAGPMAWLPIEELLELGNALRAQVGQDHLRQTMKGMVQKEYAEHQRLRSLIHAFVGFFGLHPGALVALVPRAFSLLYRDCGEWSRLDSKPQFISPKAGDEQLVLLLEDVPLACQRDHFWQENISGMLHALMVLSETRQKLIHVEEKESTLRFELSWQRR